MTERPSVTLPEPIAAYFAADRLDAEAVVRCFTNDAVVKDEGETHAGLAAIRRWKTEAAGDFPGGQVDLRFFFRLERGKIASLEIKP